MGAIEESLAQHSNLRLTDMVAKPVDALNPYLLPDVSSRDQVFDLVERDQMPGKGPLNCNMITINRVAEIPTAIGPEGEGYDASSQEEDADAYGKKEQRNWCLTQTQEQHCCQSCLDDDDNNAGYQPR